MRIGEVQASVMGAHLPVNLHARGREEAGDVERSVLEGSLHDAVVKLQVGAGRDVEVKLGADGEHGKRSCKARPLFRHRGRDRSIGNDERMVGWSRQLHQTGIRIVVQEHLPVEVSGDEAGHVEGERVEIGPQVGPACGPPSPVSETPATAGRRLR